MASTKSHVGATAVEMTAKDREIIEANSAAAAEVRKAHLAKECDREFERSNVARRLRGQDPQTRDEFLETHPEYCPDDKDSPAYAAKQAPVTFGASSPSSPSSPKKRAASGAKKSSAKKRAAKK